MNIYGLLFSFMIPGILIGFLVGATFTKRRQVKPEHKRKQNIKGFTTFNLSGESVSRFNSISKELELFPCIKKTPKRAANY